MSEKKPGRWSEEAFVVEGGADEFQDLFPTTRLPSFVVDAPTRSSEEAAPDEKRSVKSPETER